MRTAKKIKGVRSYASRDELKAINMQTKRMRVLRTRLREYPLVMESPATGQPNRHCGRIGESSERRCDPNAELDGAL
ncbi:hypothetical protein EVAR_19576_1 [Eumeta japonica]|uniref:Uncharacterized protein n=1 Tax=Eumeta variegata TaxID=151549 RepID=A0A4C1UGL1_EUMVA|nr:hypothetical protein EVAR_19576_1 [Eumeta japonica]